MLEKSGFHVGDWLWYQCDGKSAPDEPWYQGVVKQDSFGRLYIYSEVGEVSYYPDGADVVTASPF